jgi:hypothetical protein
MVWCRQPDTNPEIAGAPQGRSPGTTIAASDRPAVSVTAFARLA